MRVRPSGLRTCNRNCSGWRLRLQRMHIFQRGLDFRHSVQRLSWRPIMGRGTSWRSGCHLRLFLLFDLLFDLLFVLFLPDLLFVQSLIDLPFDLFDVEVEILVEPDVFGLAAG